MLQHLRAEHALPLLHLVSYNDSKYNGYHVGT